MSTETPHTDDTETERSLVDNLLADLTALEDRVDDLTTAAERIDELEARVADLEERTDMLRLIEDSDDLTAKQRSTALIQHAFQEVRNNDRTQVTFDRDRAAEILHYPDVDRTTIYSDMERCQRLIGDKDICQYFKKSQTDTDAAELRFDLTSIGDRDVDASTLVRGGD